ncbi:MAG: PaaI family thioesterase [Pseudomonadota bacterium]
MSELPETATTCFACGQDNPIGLKIRFALDGDACVGEFTPGEHHVGWEDTVHGGILYSALDDVTANYLYLNGRKAHTARCEIRYRQPARVGESLTLKGWVERERGRLVELRGEARRGSDDALVADCVASFMLAR